MVGLGEASPCDSVSEIHPGNHVTTGKVEHMWTNLGVAKEEKKTLGYSLPYYKPYKLDIIYNNKPPQPLWQHVNSVHVTANSSLGLYR